MEIQAAISKADRYSSSEQGDKVEIIERPRGGLSVIIAEGKLNGQQSRSIAMKAVHSIMNLISTGLHDGASSRIVLSNIFEEHQGKAKVSLHIISCDLESQSIVITKNNTKEIRIMCSSLRLDSIVAQLSHCSRSEALKKIHAGFVKVNDVVLEQNLQLCNNDFVSIRKTGRFQFKEVVSTTKKGRLVLNFDQYI